LVGDARRRGTAEHRAAVAALRERILATGAPVFLLCDKNDRPAHRHNLHVLHLWGVGLRDICASLRAPGGMDAPDADRMHAWGPQQDTRDVRALRLFLDLSGYELDDLQVQRRRLNHKAFAPIAMATAMATQVPGRGGDGYEMPEPFTPKPGRSSHRRRGRPT
jgi:hypothetical protein